jgi:hypothetical protein
MPPRSVSSCQLTLPITHYGTLRARLRAEVKHRLKDVQRDTEVRFRGEQYIVTKVSNQSSTGVLYSLKPLTGGKAIMMSDTKLLIGVQHDRS